MLKNKQEIVLDQRIIDSFAGVRGRVQAAVAAQPKSVSLAQALAQTQKFRKAAATAR